MKLIYISPLILYLVQKNEAFRLASDNVLPDAPEYAYPDDECEDEYDYSAVVPDVVEPDSNEKKVEGALEDYEPEVYDYNRLEEELVTPIDIESDYLESEAIENQGQISDSFTENTRQIIQQGVAGNRIVNDGNRPDNLENETRQSQGVAVNPGMAGAAGSDNQVVIGQESNSKTSDSEVVTDMDSDSNNSNSQLTRQQTNQSFQEQNEPVIPPLQQQTRPKDLEFIDFGDNTEDSSSVKIISAENKDLESESSLDADSNSVGILGTRVGEGHVVGMAVDSKPPTPKTPTPELGPVELVENGYCRQGYSTGDGHEYECRDIDECATHTDDCNAGFTCENLVGTFQCNDINECETGAHDCASGFKCVNNHGSFACEDVNECDNNTHNCPSGYVCANNHGSFTCQDINECKLNKDLCFAGTYCVNTEGAFICQDVNECSANTHNCKAGTTCVNNHGSFECRDINECAENLHNCPVGTTCQNSFGSFECRDINECSDNLHNCPAGTTCVNNHGSFECRDINECAENLHNCSSGTRCHNIFGSFECRDINECADRTHTCSEGTTCHNIYGSFECRDINECLGPNNCDSESSICVNIIGSYECQCKPGFTREIVDPLNRSCLDIDECMDQNVCDLNSSCRNLMGDYKCECGPGFERGSNNKECNNINECLTGVHNCDCAGECDGFENSRCVDSIGGHSCVCPEGYKIDQKYAVEHNGRLTCTSACDLDTQINDVLSGRCIEKPVVNPCDADPCNEGETGKICEQIEDFFGIGATYLCNCPEGWTLDEFGDCIGDEYDYGDLSYESHPDDKSGNFPVGSVVGEGQTSEFNVDSDENLARIDDEALLAGAANTANGEVEGEGQKTKNQEGESDEDDYYYEYDQLEEQNNSDDHSGVIHGLNNQDNYEDLEDYDDSDLDNTNQISDAESNTATADENAQGHAESQTMEGTSTDDNELIISHHDGAAQANEDKLLIMDNGFNSAGDAVHDNTVSSETEAVPRNEKTGADSDDGFLWLEPCGDDEVWEWV